MTRCIACGATLAGDRCPSCSPAPKLTRAPRPPDRQQELAWEFFRGRGWRYAAFAVPVLVASSIVVALVAGDAGGSVFFALGAFGWALYGIVKWRDEHLP